jgi:hypothetical protein
MICHTDATLHAHHARRIRRAQIEIRSSVMLCTASAARWLGWPPSQSAAHAACLALRREGEHAAAQRHTLRAPPPAMLPPFDGVTMKDVMIGALPSVAFANRTN